MADLQSAALATWLQRPMPLAIANTTETLPRGQVDRASRVVQANSDGLPEIIECYRLTGWQGFNAPDPWPDSFPRFTKPTGQPVSQAACYRDSMPTFDNHHQRTSPCSGRNG